MQDDIIRRLHVALPSVRAWIEEYLLSHADKVRTVHSLGIRRLSECFPEELLVRAKTVTVPQPPFPPVERFGLPEFAPVQQMAFDGITFKDTYFLRQGHTSESLHFHELVHVVQWARLGVDNFLVAYAVGLLQHGYEQSPLEQMAYGLQGEFERRVVMPRLVQRIETLTDAIWQQVAPIVAPASLGS
jgi:hypothetical protein